MAHSANRSIDFAPAWLKLPEQSQEKKTDFTQSNPRAYLPRKGGHSFLNIKDYNQTHNHSHHHQQQDYSNHPLHQQQPGRHIRPTPNYNSRTVSQSNQLHRSQSTGSYNDNGHRPVTKTVNSNPLEEDFPLLSRVPASSPTHNHIGSTAQWRIKQSAAEQQRARDDSSNKSGQTNDKLLLTSNMPGKVYRAQVRPVRRSHMIPISNGKNSSVKNDENGEHDGSALSSSVEKEKRLLQEMGWKEDDDSEDDCVIPEQDPEQLQEIFMKAKAARERLLMKSKHSMKPTVTAVLPNEDDLPSSSDNSDAE